MNATYKDGRLSIDAGKKMNLEEIGEFVHFILLFVNPKNVDIRQNVEDGNRTTISLDLDRDQAVTLKDKLQFNCDI